MWLMILGLIMLYALVHGQIVSYKNFNNLSGYDKFILIFSTLVIVSITLWTMYPSSEY